MSKPKLSGAQRRKAARQKALAMGGAVVARPLSAERLPPVKEEDLDTVAGNRRELSRIYGLARSGQLLPEVATRLTYILCQNAGLCRIEEELREWKLAREELMRQHEHGTIDLLPVQPQAGSNGQDGEVHAYAQGDQAPLEVTP